MRDPEKAIKVLLAEAANYGKDSYDYEMVGGDRKRPTRKLDSVA